MFGEGDGDGAARRVAPPLDVYDKAVHGEAASGLNRRDDAAIGLMRDDVHEVGH